MNWYSDYGEQWREIIVTISREYKRMNIMIEKDIVQSMFLYQLSKVNLPLVFKGGTSLSKAYNIIDRFSEDLDFSMSRKPTSSEKRNCKESIIRIGEKLGLILVNASEIKSRYDYNKYEFQYDSLFSDTPMEIIVETSFYLPSYPAKLYSISSFVEKFCTENDIKLPVPFEAINYEMLVQTPERTFVDKIFAICDYKIANVQRFKTPL